MTSLFLGSNLRRIEIAVDGQGTFESFRVTRANEGNTLRIALGREIKFYEESAGANIMDMRFVWKE